MSSKTDLKTDNMSVNQDRQAENEFALSVGARVQLAANKNALKQSDIANYSGLDRRRINAYWHGKQVPTGENLMALASALGVDPRWLVLGTEGVATQLLGEVDRLVEAGENRQVASKLADLRAIWLDTDLSQAIRNRAGFALMALGDKDALAQRRVDARQRQHLDDRLHRVIDSALDQAEEEAGIALGPAIRQKTHNLCGFLAYSDMDSLDSGMLNYTIRELVAATIAQFDAMLGTGHRDRLQPARLHSPQLGFRHKGDRD